MTGLRALWLPVLLSSVAVFLVSWVIHAMLPWHKGDYHKLPDEDKARDLLRPLNIPPGDYMVPRPGSMADMRSPQFQEKMKQGPNFTMTVLPSGMPAMGSMLLTWFVYLLAVSVCSAYVAGRASPWGASYLHVFRFVGVTAFLAYGAALCQFSIWYSRSWDTTIRYLIDALLYACVTAGFFGWLWPH